MGMLPSLLLLAYLALVALASLYTWYILWGMPSLDLTKEPADHPLVSIIVPVRNEEPVVGRCVESLLAVEYPNKEILFVDGGSTDATLEILAHYEGRIRVLREPPLPPGWVGKNWACHTAFQQAHGDLLLFSDGDTVHAPRGLGAAVAYMQRVGADLVTLYPRLLREGFWEKLMLPIVGFLIVVRHRGRFVNRDDRHYFIGIGPFLLIKRSVYEAVGGHEAVRDRIDEDLRIGQRVKHAGYRLRALRGEEALELRMYEHFGELWEGWVKNISPGLDYNPGKMAFAVFLAVFFFLGPFVVLAGGIALLALGGSPLALWVGLLTTSMAIFTLWPLYVEGPQDAPFPFLLPLGAVVFVAMAVASWYQHRFGGGVMWKGRRYNPLGEAPPGQ